MLLFSLPEVWIGFRGYPIPENTGLETKYSCIISTNIFSICQEKEHEDVYYIKHCFSALVKSLQFTLGWVTVWKYDKNTTKICFIPFKSNKSSQKMFLPRG
jgi:hypothetical protein